MPQNVESFLTVNVPVVALKLKSVENVSFDVLNVDVSLDVLFCHIQNCCIFVFHCKSRTSGISHAFCTIVCCHIFSGL